MQKNETECRKLKLNWLSASGDHELRVCQRNNRKLLYVIMSVKNVQTDVITSHFHHKAILISAFFTRHFHPHFKKLDSYFGTPWLPDLLCKHWFASLVWNFCRWVADVPPRETSPEAKSRRNGCLHRLQHIKFATITNQIRTVLSRNFETWDLFISFFFKVFLV